jgi:hypothetical protein
VTNGLAAAAAAAASVAMSDTTTAMLSCLRDEDDDSRLVHSSFWAPDTEMRLSVASSCATPKSPLLFLSSFAAT